MEIIQLTAELNWELSVQESGAPVRCWYGMDVHEEFGRKLRLSARSCNAS